MPRLQQFHGKPGRLHRRKQPLRQWPGLRPDPLKAKAQRTELGDQGFRFAGHLRLSQNLAVGVNNTHARAFRLARYPIYKAQRKSAPTLEAACWSHGPSEDGGMSRIRELGPALMGVRKAHTFELAQTCRRY